MKYCLFFINIKNSFFHRTTTSFHFTACIVDEAGQCVEPLNYVPILLGIDKLVLVGDDKQLQPVIKSKVSKISLLNKSLKINYNKMIIGQVRVS